MEYKVQKGGRKISQRNRLDERRGKAVKSGLREIGERGDQKGIGKENG